MTVVSQCRTKKKKKTCKTIKEFSVSENDEEEEEGATVNIFSALNNTVSILPDAGNIFIKKLKN